MMVRIQNRFKAKGNRDIVGSMPNIEPGKDGNVEWVKYAGE